MLTRYGASIVTAGIGAVVAVVTNLALARLMGPGGFGVVGVTLAAVFLVAVVAELGLGNAGARYLSASLGAERYSDCRNLARLTLFVMVSSAAVCGLLLWLGARPLASVVASEGLGAALRSLAPFMPVLGLFHWGLMILKGLGWNLAQIALESLWLQVVILLIAIPAWWWFGDVEAVLLGYGLAYTIVALAAAAYGFRSILLLPRGGDSVLTSAGELFGQGIPLTLTGMCNRLLRRGDIFIVGAVLGDSAAGIYRAGYTIATLARPLRKAVNTFAIHHIARSHGMARHDLMRNHFDLNLHVSLIIALPIAFVTIVLAPEIVALLFGQEYSGARMVVVILAAAQVFVVMSGPVQSVYGAYKANWQRLMISLGAAAFSLSLTAYLAWTAGLMGAAIGVTMGFLALFAGLIVYGQARIFDKRVITVSGMGNAIACLIIACGTSLADPGMVIRILIAMIGGAWFVALECRRTRRSALHLSDATGR